MYLVVPELGFEDSEETFDGSKSLLRNLWWREGLELGMSRGLLGARVGDWARERLEAEEEGEKERVAAILGDGLGFPTEESPASASASASGRGLGAKKREMTCCLGLPIGKSAGRWKDVE